MSNRIPRTKNNEIIVDNAMNMNSQCAAAAVNMEEEMGKRC